MFPPFLFVIFYFFHLCLSSSVYESERQKILTIVNKASGWILKNEWHCIYNRQFQDSSVNLACLDPTILLQAILQENSNEFLIIFWYVYGYTFRFRGHLLLNIKLWNLINTMRERSFETFSFQNTFKGFRAYISFKLLKFIHNDVTFSTILERSKEFWHTKLYKLARVLLIPVEFEIENSL